MNYTNDWNRLRFNNDLVINTDSTIQHYFPVVIGDNTNCYADDSIQALRVGARTDNKSPAIEIIGAHLGNFFSNYLQISTSQNIEDMIPWLSDIETKFEETVEPEDTLILFEHLDQMLQKHHLREIDFLLSNVSNLKLSHELIASLLRFTSPLKMKLKKWDFALKQLQKKMAERSLDVEGTLFGMI